MEWMELSTTSAKHRPDLLGLRLREEGLCAIFLGLRLRKYIFLHLMRSLSLSLSSSLALLQ